MVKRLCAAIILSLLYCLPIFGEENLEKNIQRNSEETSLFDMPKNSSNNEQLLDAAAHALDHMALIITPKEGNEPTSITFPQEIQSVSMGQSYNEFKETAKRLAEEAVLQPSQPENRWGISLTPAEVDLLTRIVMLEAGGESPLGQQAVTEVILNRMVSPYYGGSLEHVLSTKGQFTTWKMRYSAQAAPTPQVIASVNAVLRGETNILPFQTLYFSRKPQNRRIQISIGRHTFCNQ